MEIKYPIKLTFKLFAFVPQIYIYDADGKEVMYIYQRFWKIKEKIDIFSNRAKEQKLYEVNADRVIDFSPRFTITDQGGHVVGAIKRFGMKSLFVGKYEVYDGSDRHVFDIVEANPVIKFLDGFLSEVPIIGIFTGLFLHPKYEIREKGTGQPVALINKTLSFSERLFNANLIQKNISAKDKELIALSMLMIVLLERRRG